MRVEHRVYVAMPTNLGAYPYTAEQAGAAVDQVLAWWRASLPGVFVSLTRVAGPVPYTATTIPDADHGCGTQSAAGVKEAEQLLGAVPNDRDGVATHVVVLLPPACAGGVGQTGSAGMPTNTYSDSWSMVGPHDLAGLPFVFAHELGHNFGFNHAQAPCAYGCPFPGNPLIEYGDCWSVMATRIGVVSTAARAQGGLLQPGELVSYDGSQGSEDQPVVLQPRSALTGQRGLEVTDPETGQTWYLDYRANTGLDTTFTPSGCTAGVTVTTIADQRHTMNLAHPGVPMLNPNTWSWGTGEVIQLSPNVSVQVGALDPVAGAQVQVRIQSPPPFKRVPRARISGILSRHHGGIARVRLERFSPRPTRLTYRWYLDGELIRGLWGDADDVNRMSVPWEGGRLVAEVTAYRAGHRRAVVRTPAARVLRSLELPQARITGKLQVGQQVRVTFARRSTLPRGLKAIYIWRVGDVRQPTQGPTLELTPGMAHDKIQVQVWARTHRTRWTTRLTDLSSPIQP
jgi:hypothetical protein